MSDTYIGIASVSTGDKKIDNSLVTVGGESVNRQRINLSDPVAADAHAAVVGSSPGSSEYGLVVRPLLPSPLPVIVSSSAGAVPVSGTVNALAAIIAGSPSSGQLPAALSSGGFLSVAVLSSTGTQAVSGSVGITTTSGVPITDAGGSLTIDSTGLLVVQSGTWSVGVTTTSGIPVNDGGGSLTVDGVVAVTAATSGFSAQISAGTNTSGQLPSALSAGGFLSVAVMASTGVQAVSGTVGLSSGVTVSGAVGVTSTSGGPVNIQDNGGSLTVDGTVTAQLASSSGGGLSAVIGAAVPPGAQAMGLTDGTNMRIQAGDGVGNAKVRRPGTAFAKTHTPTFATQATVNTSAKGGTIRNVVKDLCITICSSAAPTVTAGGMIFSVFDGTSAGTRLWSQRVTIPATAGATFTLALSDLWLEGTANTAMTFCSEATPAIWAGVTASIAMSGHTIPE